MANLYSIFEIIGTIAFAISGATTAIRREFDLFGVVVLGMITSVGGGMLRDVIGNSAPAIFYDRTMLLLAFITSIITFLVMYNNINLTATKYFHWIFTISDAIGLAVFTVFGCQKMLPFYQPGVCVFFGVLTGVAGGLIRDVLAGQTPYVLSKHFYACSCIIGATIYVFLQPHYGSISILAGISSIFVLRILAVKFRWNLPKVPLDKD